MLGDLTRRVKQGTDLTEEESGRALESILAESSDQEIAEFLTALAEKGETADEITGFARVMKSNVIPIKSGHEKLVDTAGTGGGKSTFNISTAAAFVISGAGIPVAKHGNRAVTSKCGSADVLSELGMIVDRPPACSSAALEEIGICFLFAPTFHPAMKRVAKVRKSIGRRTIFNMLGPLTNPASALFQVIGVYAPELTAKMADAARRLGSRRVWVVHSRDGLDEVSIGADTWVSESSSEGVRSFEFKPIEKKLGLPTGGIPEQNASLIRGILNRSVTGPARDVVVLNAAVAIHIATGKSLTSALENAEESILSGAALEKLDTAVEFYRRWTR